LSTNEFANKLALMGEKNKQEAIEAQRIALQLNDPPSAAVTKNSG
jgi:hypothetical protein